MIKKETTVTARLSIELDEELTLFAEELDRSKGYIIKKALKYYMAKEGERLIALARLARGEETISLEEIEEGYDL